MHQEMSKNPFTRFRHDRLTRGVCLSECVSELAGLNSETLSLLDVEKFEYNNWPPAQWPPKTFRKAFYYRRKYGKIINMCMNRRLQSKFSLSGYANIEYCDTNREHERDLDALDIGFGVLVGLIMIFVIFSSYYDFILNRENSSKRDDHFTTKRDSCIQNALLTFSFYRNWKKLFGPRPIGDHKTIHFWKILICFIVIFVHVIAFVLGGPSNNKYFFEINADGFIFNFIGSATIGAASFFTISGILLSYGCYNLIDQKPGLRNVDLILMIVKRYLR